MAKKKKKSTPKAKLAIAPTPKKSIKKAKQAIAPTTKKNTKKAKQAIAPTPKKNIKKAKQAIAPTPKKNIKKAKQAIAPTPKKNTKKAKQAIAPTTKKSIKKAKQAIAPTTKKSIKKAKQAIVPTTKVYKTPTCTIPPQPVPSPKPVPIPPPAYSPTPIFERQRIVKDFNLVAMKQQVVVESSSHDAKLDTDVEEDFYVAYNFQRDKNGKLNLTEHIHSTRIVDFKKGQLEKVTSTSKFVGGSLEKEMIPEPSGLTRGYTLTKKIASTSISPIEWGNNDVEETWEYSLMYSRNFEGSEVITESFYRTTRDYVSNVEINLESMCRYENKSQFVSGYPTKSGGFICGNAQVTPQFR